MSDKSLKFSLRGLFLGSLLVLGAAMWFGSLALPAVSNGSILSGWDCLLGSFMTAFGSSEWGGWSAFVLLMHLMFFGSFVLQLTYPWPGGGWRKVWGVLLVAGSLLLELGLAREFEATYRGFHLWCMSFLVVGVGLWLQAGRNGPSWEE